MVEEGAEGMDGEGPGEGGLQGQIGHWVEVLDRWVKELDRGMGRLRIHEIKADSPSL